MRLGRLLHRFPAAADRWYAGICDLLTSAGVAVSLTQRASIWRQMLTVHIWMAIGQPEISSARHAHWGRFRTVFVSFARVRRLDILEFLAWLVRQAYRPVLARWHEVEVVSE